MTAVEEKGVVVFQELEARDDFSLMEIGRYGMI